MNKNKHYHLYILKLEKDKYYVGVTSKTPEQRFKEHKNGFLAAKWVKKYKPIEIIQTKDLGLTTYKEAALFESRVTRKYIEKYGKENVRGGDLNYSGKYVYHFGRYFRDSDWKNIVGLLLMLGSILLLVVDKYFW